MLIHCTMDELIAIRDGEGSPAALEHLESCDDCTDEMERLHQRIAALKALPVLHAPRERWSIVRGEVLAARNRKRRRLATWMSLATAASVVLAVGLTQLPIGFAASGAGDAEGQDEFVVLVEESQSLEQMLRNLRPERRVLTGRQASAIAALEDRLSVIEARLGEARVLRLPQRDVMLLLQQRVELMDALVDVHRVKSTLIGF